MPTNEALALRVREGDGAATEQLWNQVKRYAYTIVRRYGTTATVDFDDLMQTAYFGMLRAASIYDGEHAFLPILSYAIRNTCRRLYSGHCVEAEASLDAPLRRAGGSAGPVHRRAGACHLLRAGMGAGARHPAGESRPAVSGDAQRACYSAQGLPADRRKGWRGRASLLAGACRLHG